MSAWRTCINMNVSYRSSHCLSTGTCRFIENVYRLQLRIFFTCSIVAYQDRPHHSHDMPVRGLWNWCFIRGIVVSVLTIIVTCEAVWPGRVYLGINVNQLVSSRLSVKLVSEVRVLGVPSQRPDGEIGASIRLYNESVKEPLPDVVNCLTQLYSSWFE